MRPNIDECDLFAVCVEENEQDAVPGIDGEAPNVLELAVQLMRVKSGIELGALKDGDLRVGE